MASLDRKAEGLYQNSASARGMQTPSSRVPTAKHRDLTQKQRSSVWTGSRPIATFLRCLRLLDLDLLEDWPGITENTFSTLAAKQNIQARIKCVEWSLYRLLELWSPSGTRDKLRPFFPPLTPLQSLNLRAALYRFLTELKKDGVLGKETLLRKTMLDECKGEKFEELISGFAVTVLRRSASARKDIRLELACSNYLTGQLQAQLLPLIIAHRSSLQQQLSQHRKIQAQAEMYHGLLEERHVSVDNRRALLSRLPVPEVPQKPRSCEDMADSWTGDDRWAETLVSGPGRSEDRFLESSFEAGWKAVQNEERVDFGCQTDLLKDLNARVANQETRLRKWKTFAASLRNTQEQRKQTLPPPTSSEKRDVAMPQFDSHQSLQFSDKNLLARSVEHRVPTASVHKTLLALMEAEIACLARRKPVESTMSPDVQGPISRNSSEMKEQELDYLPPLRKLSRDVPKKSSIVPISELGCLDSKAASPPAPSRFEDTTARHIELTLMPGQYVKSEPTEIKALMSEVAPKGLPQGVGDIQHARAHVSDSVGALPAPSRYKQYFGTDVIPNATLSMRGAPEELLMPPSSLTINKDPWTSFAAAHNDTKLEEQTEHFAFEPRVTPLRQSTKPNTLDQRDIHYMASPLTLLERTRQSMSLQPNPAHRAGLRSTEKGASSKQTRLSQAFPVNQFETPRRMSKTESSQLERITPRSGSSTPRDDLFSDAAAYDSVFKSRPRIAQSPALSPDQSDMGLDSMLEEDLADLTLEGDR